MKWLGYILSILLPFMLGITLVFYLSGERNVFMSVNDFMVFLTRVIPDVPNAISVLNGITADMINLPFLWWAIPLVTPFLYTIGLPIYIIGHILISIIAEFMTYSVSLSTFDGDSLPSTPFDDLDTSCWLEIISDSIVTL